MEVLSEYSLHGAAKVGKAERVKALIASGRDVNAKEGQRKRTPANVAAVSGQNKALKLLLEADADVNAGDGVSVTICGMIHLCLYLFTLI